MSDASSGDFQGPESSKDNGATPIPARRLFCDAQRMPNYPPDVVAHLEPLLHTMRRTQEHCDVVFRTTDGGQLRAHRFVLSSRFPGCGTFFASKNKEPNTVGWNVLPQPTKQDGDRQWPAVAEVYVNDLSFDMLEIVVGLAYRVPLRERVGHHNVSDFLEVAEALDIAEIRDFCIRLLEENLSVDNCVGRYQLAMHRKYAPLERAAFRYMLQNFDQIWTTSPEFQSLTVEHLRALLADDELHVPDEIKGTIGAILKWISGNAPERRSHLTKLLKLVRFSSCGSADILRIMHKQDVSAKNSVLEFLSVVKAVLEFREVRGDDRLSTFHWLRPRIPKDILFMFGGWTDGATNHLMTYNCHARRWQLLANQRTPRRAHHGVAVLDGLVYFVGGFDGRECYSSVVCLDVGRKKWTTKANMNAARGNASVAVLEGHIYAMGGYDGARRTASCERYDSSRNEWNSVASMHVIRSNAAAVTAAGHIYVMGGTTGLQVLNSVERYDAVTDAWTRVHGMLTPRRGHKAVVRDDVVYVIGGHDGFEALSAVEQLNVHWGVWADLPDMARPRCNCAAALFQGSIYVAGGFDDISTVSSVERYDIEAGEWLHVPGLSVPRSSAVAWTSDDVPDPKYWLPEPAREEDGDEEEEEEE